MFCNQKLYLRANWIWRMLALVEVIVPNVACGSTLEFPQPVGVAQLDVIGGVKHFHAELECWFLGDAEILNRREIEVHLVWANQVVARAVSELRHHRVGKGG